ncbi:MAG: type II toxin-antitoxin system HicB family antitoxin [Gammaproteobacteria bacterium]
MLKYKGYIGYASFDDEADIFHGEVVNTRDVITFQGTTVNALKKAFKDSINDYIAFCAARGETPERPFSGKFNVRLSPELHQAIFIAAKKTGKSLNSWVFDALSQAVSLDAGKL